MLSIEVSNTLWCSDRPDWEATEPMPLKFALYPGCAAKGATPELYQSTMAIIGRLGIEVVELAASSCCGAGVIGEADPDLALALNARNVCAGGTARTGCHDDLRHLPGGDELSEPASQK